MQRHRLPGRHRDFVVYRRSQRAHVYRPGERQHRNAAAASVRRGNQVSALGTAMPRVTMESAPDATTSVWLRRNTARPA